MDLCPCSGQECTSLGICELGDLCPCSWQDFTSFVITVDWPVSSQAAHYQIYQREIFYICGKGKGSRYRPSLGQRVGRGIALLFHDRGTRRGWVVSSTPRPHFTPGKDTVPILREAEWAPGPVWTGGKSSPHRDSIPDRPARSSVAIPTELPDTHSQ